MFNYLVSSRGASTWRAHAAICVKKKKKKKSPSATEMGFFPLLQLTLESKVHFSLLMTRIKAEPTRTIAVALDDKCQTEILADMED